MSATRDLTALTQHYVECSNRHDLAAIGPMFAEDAVYRSSSVGTYQGRAAILEMMTTFFESFPDVTWEIADTRPDRNRAVVFDFTMRATKAESGEVIVRNGVELLRFSDSGSITEIDVQVTA
ncbi:nuclear transport factor 2 family protein [Pelagibius sp. Alg239-R121]|uniref:nuclear transport factor 2 family protein n=1 Tax=Pelagibius sp. Alg239-R121 TaxID=2993448 RepID=UPI0024A668E4|nr:nuclear transport factor 2 family protein [Pelagibius sp. Alg239-R121]